MPFLKNIGTTELIIIAVILFFLFGGKKLSEWARGFGETSRELKKIKKDFTTAIDDVTNDDEPNTDKSTKRKGVA